jgi:hypothetical protein
VGLNFKKNQAITPVHIALAAMKSGVIWTGAVIEQKTVGCRFT